MINTKISTFSRTIFLYYLLQYSIMSFNIEEDEDPHLPDSEQISFNDSQIINQTDATIADNDLEIKGKRTRCYLYEESKRSTFLKW
jgi:hypothetical protein